MQQGGVARIGYSVNRRVRITEVRISDTLLYPQTIVTFEDKVNVFSTCLATETNIFRHRDKKHSYKDANGAL